MPCKYINEKPIGAGCIAVVYEVILKNDQKVVVKIKRPNIYEELIQSMKKVDKLIYYSNFFCIFKSMELGKRLEDLKELIFNQLDFDIELEETNYFYKKYKKHPFIMTPKPFNEYSNKSQIVLEFIEGKQIDNLNQEEREKLSLPFTGMLISSMFMDGHYHGDLHTGNMMVVGDKLCIYDFGLVCNFNDEADKETAYNYYMSLMNKEWDKASNILLNRMCEKKIKKEKAFLKSIKKILVFYFETNEVWDPISYIRAISKCIKKYGSVMSKSFVKWELSMITVQGTITQICKKNIWELCREINEIYSLE